MHLQAVNTILGRLGYQEVGEDQLAALMAVVPGYERWLLSCSALEQDSPHWNELRSAQFGASPACAQALEALKVEIPMEDRIRILVAAEPQLRISLAEIVRRGVRGCPPGAIDLARKAFARYAGKSAPHASTGAGAPPATGPSLRTTHKVHGARFALTFEETTSPSGAPALQVEAAERLPGSRQFDWRHKIALQLLDHEVVQLLSVLNGGASSACFRFHGPSRDKTLEVSAQPERDSFHVVLRQAEVARAVPVPRQHTFRLMAMCINTLRASSPALSAADVMALAGAATRSPVGA